jgi:Large ribosomal RNA subunit accumulation protein YceD
MPEKRAQRAVPHGSGHPWRVPVVQAEVPEGGLHLDLVPDEKVRADIAVLAGLVTLPRLDANFDVTRHGRSGLHVIGRVSASVGQTCGVTLEPIQNEVDEAVDLVFVPSASRPAGGHEGEEVEIPLADAPEALLDGVVDLGVVATEFLILGIDPYPRKPGSVFQARSVDEDSGQPFAALAALKRPATARKAD